MRALRAVFPLVVGAGLAAGCGPTPPATGDGDTSRSKGQTDKLRQPRDSRRETGKASDPAAKVKEAADALRTELEPVTKAVETLRGKVEAAFKEAGQDATKLGAANKLKTLLDDAGVELKRVTDKISEMVTLKDTAAVEDAKRKVSEQIGKLKETLKDHLPK